MTRTQFIKPSVCVRDLVFFYITTKYAKRAHKWESLSRARGHNGLHDIFLCGERNEFYRGCVTFVCIGGK
jgi:hypothetical protein